MKICPKCKILKPLSKFGKDKHKKDGHNHMYKICRRLLAIQSSKKYRKKNPEKIKIAKAKYYSINKDHICAQVKIYYSQNTEKIKSAKSIYNKFYYKKKKKYKRAYENSKRKNNIQYKLAANLRNRTKIAIHNNQKVGSAINDLGCSIKELKQYLEKQFHRHPITDELMSWNNYGLYGWHIDHIIPLSSFDLTNRAQFLQACHYTNLQPLWAKENISKSNKF